MEECKHFWREADAHENNKIWCCKYGKYIDSEDNCKECKGYETE